NNNNFGSLKSIWNDSIGKFSFVNRTTDEWNNLPGTTFKILNFQSESFVKFSSKIFF
ncbi:hypothetical protein L9F63_022771, partial [Diploptera punctata]